MKKIITISAISVFIIMMNVRCHQQLSNSMYNLFGSQEEREIIRYEKAKAMEYYKSESANKHPIRLLRIFSRINPKIKIKL